MERVKKFLEALRLDPQAQRMARSFRRPENEEEAAEGYALLAREMGLEIDLEEMKSGLRALTEAAREKSDAVGKDTETLIEEELDGVAGGSPGAWYPAYCKELFEEGEWCWYADSCNGAINNYQVMMEEIRD